MKVIKPIIMLGIALIFTVPVIAQEGEAVLVDEVIARVNAGVIMRSAFDSAQRDVLDEMKKQGLQGDELAKKFKEWQPRILDELVNNQLLAQRAKDLSINVEAQVNQQLLRMMKENNCESLECLGQKMRDAGYDMDEIRKVMTENYSKEAVLGREVYGRVYQQLTEKEKRDAYEKNKQYFTEPGEVTLSRIFIASGNDPNRALDRVKEIVIQARGGVADFAALAQRYSEEPLGKDGGKLGAAIKIPDLAAEVKAAVENLKQGEITDPVKLENGYYIFRVDELKEPVMLPFEDEKVQDSLGRYLVGQRAEAEVEEYLEKLRRDAFIEIDQRYQFENSKVKSVPIKRVPYSDENIKGKKNKN